MQFSVQTALLTSNNSDVSICNSASKLENLVIRFSNFFQPGGTSPVVSLRPLNPFYVFYFFSNTSILSNIRDNLQILPITDQLKLKNLRYLSAKIPFVIKARHSYTVYSPAFQNWKSRAFSFRLADKIRSSVRKADPKRILFFSLGSCKSAEVQLLYSRKVGRRIMALSRYNSYSVSLLWHYIYKDPIVEKFINNLMRNGKRALAEAIFFKTLSHIKESSDKQPLYVFYKALQASQPVLEPRAFLRSGKTYYIPKEITLRRRIMLAIKNLIYAAKIHPDKKQPFYVRLASELLSASLNEGRAVERVREMHEKAFANRAYLNYSRKKKRGVSAR